MSFASGSTGNKVYVKAVMHGAVPRVDGDSVRGVEIDLAFGQIEIAGGYEPGGCQSEQKVDDAPEHEKRKHGDPCAGGTAAQLASENPSCRK